MCARSRRSCSAASSGIAASSTGKYFQCYPALVFPASYVGSDEPGVYFHWLSFVGPERRTPMIMQGIHFVHTAEIRSLKAALERKAGHDAAAPGRFAIETASIFVDAPLDLAADYLGDLRAMTEWAYFIRPMARRAASAARSATSTTSPSRLASAPMIARIIDPAVIILNHAA